MKISKLALIFTTCIAVSACGTLREPDHFQHQQIQVTEEGATYRYQAHEIDDQKIASIAHQFEAQGDGPVEVAVTYDPAHGGPAANKARQYSEVLATKLHREGVALPVPKILPLPYSNGNMEVWISYQSYAVLPPPDCSMMPGYEARDVDIGDDYQLGCTTETLFARQIARPKDLKGVGASDEPSSGRRAANMSSGYYAGVPNERLEGESASGQ